MALSKVALATYRVLATVLGQSRIRNYRLGDHAVGDILNAWYVRFQRSTVTDPIPVGGHQFYLTTGQTCFLDMALGLWELKTVRLVRCLLRPGMTFVDVGAHCGWYTVLAARAVGGIGHVYAFEPEPSNFALLQKNVVINGYERCVTLERKAICDVPRRVTIFTSREDSGYSSIHATPGVGPESVEAEATTLDQFFGDRGWPRVDLM